MIWSEIGLYWLLLMFCNNLVNVLGEDGKAHDIENESKVTGNGVNANAHLKQEEDESDIKGSISALQRSLPTDGERTIGIPNMIQDKHLFTEHRSSQLEAVKAIISFGDNTRRYELVNMMLKQLFKTLESAQQNLTSFGFLPGDPFPENETIRDAVSKVLENTALFGDMVLRLPDVVHEFYDRQKDWQLTLAWSYGFCIQSQVFESANEKLLNLMAQEVNLIPVDPNYINPFKAANQPKEMHQEEKGKVEKKKPKKKIKRGPRMSHTEL